MSPINISNEKKINKSCNNLNRTKYQNSSKDRSTTLVSSLNSEITLSISKFKSLQTPVKKSYPKECKKIPNFDSIKSSSTPRSVFRSLSKDKVGSKNPILQRNISLSASKSLEKTSLSQSDIGKESIISSIKNETSSHSLDEIIKKYSKQIKWIEKVKNLNPIESKFEKHLNEAYRKQKLLIDIIRKEITLNQRLENLRRSKEEKLNLKAKERESRIEKARTKKYIDDIKAKEKSNSLKQKLSKFN